MSKPFAIVTEASSGIGLEGRVTAMAWIRDRALTLALMAMFLLFLGGQLLTGFAEYNSEQTQHGHTAVALTNYLATGHLWEAIFENWESEFLQMAVFVLLTTFLIQKGSPESRRPGGARNSSIPILATSPTTRTRPGLSSVAAGSCASMSIRSAWRSCSSFSSHGSATRWVGSRNTPRTR